VYHGCHLVFAGVMAGYCHPIGGLTLTGQPHGKYQYATRFLKRWKPTQNGCRFRAQFGFEQILAPIALGRKSS
jgi:hypothetical protein